MMSRQWMSAGQTLWKKGRKDVRASGQEEYINAIFWA